MITPRQVEQWLLQAESDLQAAESLTDGVSESHSRYWLQQSYEKAMKAWGLMNWPFNADDEGQFHHVFLRRHSPFLFIDGTTAPLPKSIYLLQRDARVFVSTLPYRNLLMRLDATTPDSDETKVSYRYPFISNGEHIAPCDYEDWDTYQGEQGEVRRSVRSFIKEVRSDLAYFRRRAL